MNLTADISDVELKQRWRLYWIHCIFEFSNSRLQEMSWIQGTEASWPDEAWESSFEDCLSAYFDNLALDDAYVKAIENANVSQIEADKARAFHILAYAYIEPSEDPKEILEDPEWIEIVVLAKVFWDYLKVSVTSQREIDLMTKLEKDFS
ncbi:MAG: hypothetical protein COA44_03040 [Arcobacter sp.]|nr:MAG: hypothetical protein COA44_03040 [Arcobacter sp.]